jgi:basic membrane protein A
MRKHPGSPLAILAIFALFLAACNGGGASPTEEESEAPASVPAATDEAEPTETAGAGSDLKIGLVTDVGTLDDRNFNQYSWEGAKEGAAAIGAPEPQAVVTTASADYEANIQSFVDQDYDIIVTVGFAIGDATAAAADENPDIKFIGVDQFIAADPAPDNYQGILFAEAQPGYLAGIVAASISESGHVAAIGGSDTIPPVVSYMRGYENGALSVNPDVQVTLEYISDDLNAAFNDPAGGKTFAQQLLQQNSDVDVLFQVAGKTGNGVLEAACEAGIHGIGVDVDQHESTPEAAECIVTSAEKKLTNAVRQAIERIAAGEDVGGNVFNDASNEGIGLSPYYEAEDLITDETQQLVDDALAEMAAGDLDPCSPNPCEP